MFVKEVSLIFQQTRKADNFDVIFYFEFWWPFCSAKLNSLSSLVELIMMNLSVKLFCIWISGSGGDGV